MARREGLVVDWGGVLTTDLFASFQAFCDRHGLDPGTVGRLFREDREARQALIDFECGRVEELPFAERLAAALDVPAEGLIDGLMAGAELDGTMVEAVRRARAAGIRTGLLSNSWGTRRYPRDLLGELFDGVVISGEVGIRKPDPEIYARAAEAVGLPAEACVFVDDLPFNLDPAREAGMAVVHHTGAATTIPQLEELLGVELTSGSATPR